MKDPARAWSVRGPMLTGALALVVLLAGFGFWSVTVQLADAAVASGRIEVGRNRQAIQHPEGGRAAGLLVGEGDRVAAGETLLGLEPGFLARHLAVFRPQLFEVRVRRARLETERDGATEVRFAEDPVAAAAAPADLTDLLQGQGTLFDARAFRES